MVFWLALALIVTVFVWMLQASQQADTGRSKRTAATRSATRPPGSTTGSSSSATSTRS